MHVFRKCGLMMEVRNFCDGVQLFLYIGCCLFLLFSSFYSEMGHHQINIHSFNITFYSQTETNNQTCLYFQRDQDVFILASCSTVNLNTPLSHAW